jgi:type I restriction enzyme S subunit
MASEWRDTTLGEVIRLQRGHDLPDSSRRPGNVPILGSFGITGEHDEPRTKGPGVTVGRSGASIGVVAFSAVDFWPLNTCLYVTDFQGNDPKFCFYWLKTLNLASFDSGSAQPSLNRNYIYHLPVRIPGVQEQSEIAKLLDGLDESIRLKAETKKTLETVARTIFKSWFVDFDPVRAKAEGREPEGMDAATAALFPSTFAESQLGALPEGWAAMPLYEIANFSNGAAYRDIHFSPRTEGLPVIKIAELKAGVTESTKFTETDLGERYRIEQDEVLFSWSGNPDTSIDTFIWDGGPAWLNQHIFRVRENGMAPRASIYIQLKTLRPKFAEIARDKQTTGLGHVTIADLKRLMVCKPTTEVTLRFDEIVSPILEKVASNQLTCRVLASIRDSLLPRLISGKLRMPDAEKLVEAVL